jgi:twitching motility protein PilJ
VSALKLQHGAAPAELSAAGQLVMLTQRIGKSANEFLTVEGVSPEAVFLLGKDLNSFKEIARACWTATAAGAGARRADARRARRLLKQYEDTAPRRRHPGQPAGLVSAREAQNAIATDSEPLRKDLEGLQARLADESGVGAGSWLMVLVLAVLALALPVWSAPGCGKPPAPALAELQRQSAERRSRKPSASTTPTRPPFCV